jgi:hypothetical protein
LAFASAWAWAWALALTLLQANAAYYEVPVNCGGTADTLRLLPGESSVELRLFNDYTIVEAFFQKVRDG